MFNPDFYPTPEEVIFEMLAGTDIADKVVLEPSAGKGNIIDYLKQNGAKEVLFCESNDDLATISGMKARFLKPDFLTLEAHEISHIDLIVMNPPFSADEHHILHAYDIAPAGCRIVALCNANTYENTYNKRRTELKNLIEGFGSFQNLGQCFEGSERTTNVSVGLIILEKPSSDYSTEFEGFYMTEDDEQDGNGIMAYNVVRDLVNRYVESIKIFDRQLEESAKMSKLTSGYFSVQMGMSVTENNLPIERNTFKKEMQKSGWEFIFNKLNLTKYVTRGVKSDINTFVEKQTNIPFTMRNIYRMLEIIVGTREQTMDKAILEVFDKVTLHHHENRHNVEGWKTNGHYLLNQRFIIPNMCYQDQRWYKGSSKIEISSYVEILEDLLKALCLITGDNYDKKRTLYSICRNENKIFDAETGEIIEITDNYSFTRRMSELSAEGRSITYGRPLPSYGEWFEWEYFKVKAHKKGTLHLEFKDRELWARFNQRVAKIKGFPLFEKAPDKRTERQKQRDENKKETSTLKPAKNFSETIKTDLFGIYDLVE